MKPGKLLALGAAALLLALAGCREDRQEDGALRIGVAVYKGEDTYLSNMTQAMQESVDLWCAETGDRIQISLSDAQESQNTQNEQIDRFLSLGYDVLCVNLVDRTDAARVVDKAREAGVPLVFFNREPVQEDIDAWDQVYYVGSDARQSAQLQAQIVLDLWESDPDGLDRNGDGVLQYMMLEGESRHQDAVIRTEVSVQTLREAGVPLERVESGIANWDRNQAPPSQSALWSTRSRAHPVQQRRHGPGGRRRGGTAGAGVPNIVGIDGILRGWRPWRGGCWGRWSWTTPPRRGHLPSPGPWSWGRPAEPPEARPIRIPCIFKLM